jgi:hypothetical protein
MSSSTPSLILTGISPSSHLVDVVLQRSESPVKPLEKLSDIAHTFVLVGARGGFPELGFAPDHSTLNLVSEITIQPGIASFRLGVRHINPNAYQLLRNMAAKLSREGFFVSRLLVSDPEQKGVKPIAIPELNDENEEELYPEISSKVALQIEWEPSDFSKVRRFLVQTTNPPEPAQVAAIADWINPWCVMLELGGFAMPIDVQESESFGGSITQFDEVTVEIVVDRFMASECAWNVLINMIDAYGRTSFPVARVIID